MLKSVSTKEMINNEQHVALEKQYI